MTQTSIAEPPGSGNRGVTGGDPIDLATRGDATGRYFRRRSQTTDGAGLLVVILAVFWP
jgi:hypothetical protein